jgi:ADP-dependent NAD(P)H-hydrate dehydratase
MTIKIPSRPINGHKGTFGSVAVIGGQINGGSVMLGSVAFAAKAAIRSGVGLIYFAGQKEVLIELVKMVPQAVGQNIKSIKNCSAIVIGPGLGQSVSSHDYIKAVLCLKLPTVIDADGLNILAKNSELIGLVHKSCVLTPHPGEFDRLAATAKIQTADELAQKLNCTVVLKGHQTLVTNGHQKWTSKNLNPALATGGTGDVLAGLTGGFLAQHFPGLSAFECAKLGVKVHSQAGLYWQKQHGEQGLMIDELIDLIPKAIKELKK